MLAGPRIRPCPIFLFYQEFTGLTNSSPLRVFKEELIGLRGHQRRSAAFIESINPHALVL
jgi:hypothetical protein